MWCPNAMTLANKVKCCAEAVFANVHMFGHPDIFMWLGFRKLSLSSVLVTQRPVSGQLNLYIIEGQREHLGKIHVHFLLPQR